MKKKHSKQTFPKHQNRRTNHGDPRNSYQHRPSNQRDSSIQPSQSKLAKKPHSLSMLQGPLWLGASGMDGSFFPIKCDPWSHGFQPTFSWPSFHGKPVTKWKVTKGKYFWKMIFLERSWMVSISKVGILSYIAKTVANMDTTHFLSICRTSVRWCHHRRSSGLDETWCYPWWCQHFVLLLTHGRKSCTILDV